MTLQVSSVALQQALLAYPGDASTSASADDLKSPRPCPPNLGYGFPGEIADDSGVSFPDQAASGLSPRDGLLDKIGRESGFSCWGYRCSKAIWEVGEESLREELKADFSPERGGDVFSGPRRGSSFRNKVLSYAWACVFLVYLS